MGCLKSGMRLGRRLVGGSLFDQEKVSVYM